MTTQSHDDLIMMAAKLKFVTDIMHGSREVQIWSISSSRQEWYKQEGVESCVGGVRIWSRARMTRGQGGWGRNGGYQTAQHLLESAKFLQTGAIYA
jgi:hypothetical protein